MVQCCVPFCKSKQGSPGKYSFHEFPVTNVRYEWLRRIARKAQGATDDEWIPSDRSKVCSRHFRQEDYRQDLKIRLLRPDAVPSIFPSAGGQEEPQRKRSRPSTDSVTVDCKLPEEEDKPASPKKKLLRVARAERPAASTRPANKRAAPAVSQRPSQKSPASAARSSREPASSPPKNLAGLRRVAPKKKRATCSSSSSDQAEQSSGPAVIAMALGVNGDAIPILPSRIQVPSILRTTAPSESLPGSAKPASPCVPPQAASSLTPLCTSATVSQTSASVSQTSVSASQTSVSASQASASASQTSASVSQANASVLQTSASASQASASVSQTSASASQASASVSQTSASASQANASVLQASASASQASASAPQTSASASQASASASQASASASQTSALALQTTSGVSLPPPPKQVVRLVQLPNSLAGKVLSPKRSQVRIIMPGAASKPLLVSLKSPPGVTATVTEPARGDLPPAVHSTHVHCKESRPVSSAVEEPAKPPERRHVRTWGSQTRLNQARLRHLCQQFRTAQRKCLKLQTDRQRLQKELAAACQRARQAQAFVKQLQLSRFQEGLAKGDPRCLFLEEQLRCLGQTRHRWREETLQCCLHWHALAPRGYRLIAQSGLLALPSSSTLKRHLHHHSTTANPAPHPNTTPREDLPSPTGDTLPGCDGIDWAQVGEGDQRAGGNGRQPADANAEEVIGTEEEVSSSVVLDDADSAELSARVDRVSREEARTACSDFSLVPSATGLAEEAGMLDIPSGQALRVIYVTVPRAAATSDGGDPFSTDAVLASSGIDVLRANGDAVPPAPCSPNVGTAPCSPGTGLIVEAEGVAEEQLLDDSPPKDLAELLNIVGVEPSQMRKLL